MPRLGLALEGTVKDSLDHIVAAVRSGGIISIGNNKVRASNGIKKVGGKIALLMSLHLLSINLPRLAYESNKDETYFRAKLALMIKPSLAKCHCIRMIVDYVKKGMVPTFASTSQLMQISTSSIMVNLTGVKESVYNILGESSEVLQKVLKTAGEVATGQGKQIGEEGKDCDGFDEGQQDSLHLILRSMARSLSYNRRIQPVYQGMTFDGRDILNHGEAAIAKKV